MKTVTLFLPSLFEKSFRKEENIFLKSLALPALQIVFSRATCLKNTTFNTENTIKFLFKGLAKDPIPAGALGALADEIITTSDQRFWCQATPIECQTDHQNAFVLGLANLALQSNEIKILVDALNVLFDEDGLTLMAANPQNWPCSIATKTQVLMKDLTEVLDKNMAGMFPTGVDEVYWRRLITECQMLLSQNIVNQERIKLNKPLISSLWFWGIGKLPTALTTHLDQIYTNDCVLRGLAKLVNIPVVTYPERFETPLLPGNTLFSDQPFFENLSQPSNGNWLNTIERIEKNWLSPLVKALRQGEIDKLKIYINNGCEYLVTKSHLYYFWRKIQTLDHIIIRMNHAKNHTFS